MKEFELSVERANDNRVFQNLMYGDETTAKDKLQYGKIKIVIADRPLCINLTEMYYSGHSKVPDHAIFKDYDFCLLFHSVGLLDTANFLSISSIGYEVRFTNRSPITVLKLIPNTEFTNIAKGNISVNINHEGSVEVGLPKDVSILKRMVGLGAEGSVSLQSDADFDFNLRFTVNTPKIISIGEGGSTSEWLLFKTSKPLTGDNKLVQLLLVKKGTRKLSMEVRVYSTISFLKFPIKLLSNDWFPIDVDVPRI